MQILRNRFDEFKRTVDAGTERFNRCERLAKWLLEDKTQYEDQVKERQGHLRYCYSLGQNCQEHLSLIIISVPSYLIYSSLMNEGFMNIILSTGNIPSNSHRILIVFEFSERNGTCFWSRQRIGTRRCTGLVRFTDSIATWRKP